MKSIEIFIELKRAGISQADIARRLDPPVTRQTVNAVIHRNPRSDSARVRAAVAAALGLPTDEVFPDKAH